ncbi:hypothetical protein [Halosolutus gelatinilyticus]|uniref:hypothetical protein n=1 Tax=Halosolutus gelatinilyticus TaxID=2931975 RepID=UPI001FF6E196|nr:hypothetical protein [Halosolutus gelatinilyticus]
MGIAVGIALLVILYASPVSNSFATGLGAIFAVGYVITGVLALGEALIYRVITAKRDRSVWTRRLVTAGAVAGSLSVAALVCPFSIAIAGILTGHHFSVGGDYLLGIGIWLVPAGVVCSGLGVVLSLVERMRSSPSRSGR